MNFSIDDKYAMPFASGTPADASLFGKTGRAADGLTPGGIGKVGQADGIDKAQKAGAADEEKKPGGKSSPADCETCKNRKYKDGSDESDVSFQTATHIDPSSAGARVRAHEQEHVSNAYSKAAEAGGKVISVGVAIHTSVCPECGRSYVSGGVTHSVIAYPQENGAPKIESTNGDPEKKPVTGDEQAVQGTESKTGSHTSGAGSRSAKQDFAIGAPAADAGGTVSADNGGTSAAAASDNAQARTQKAADKTGTAQAASNRITIPQINPYAAAQRAAEARRSSGAIFRARV